MDLGNRAIVLGTTLGKEAFRKTREANNDLAKQRKYFVVNAFRIGAGHHTRYERSGPIYYSEPVVNPYNMPQGQSTAYRIRVWPGGKQHKAKS